MTRPLLLAIESSTRWLGVALLAGESAVASEREEGGAAGAERLLPLIDALFTRSNTSIEEVEAFAVSAGPGSFTGLRVGIATIKGLAFGRGAVVAPISTLDALAHGAEVEEGVVVSALDAHRGELYASATRFGPAPSAPLLEPQVIAPAALAQTLTAAESQRLVWVGDAPHAAEALDRPVELRAPPRGAPDPVWIGRLGARQIARGEGLAPEQVIPRYLRRAEAEVLRTGNRFEENQNDV